MKLPKFPNLSAEKLQTIVERHNLGSRRCVLLPKVGIFNAIYQIGDDLVLRVPRNHPDFTVAAEKEAIAAPIAREAGVRTPQLLIFDDSRRILPVPFSIYELVPGETLGLLNREPADTPDVWRELGRDLARLHTGVSKQGPAAQIGLPEELPDPRPWPDELAAEGYLGVLEARWLSGWLAKLAPLVRGRPPRCFLHGDTQATNIIVAPGSLEYRAVIDWGSAGWGDVARDFAGVPLRAVPFMLEGYRSEGGGEGDEHLEARIVWTHLQMALFLLRREPQPEHSWAERPLGMFSEILRFFLAAPSERWGGLGPPQ